MKRMTRASRFETLHHNRDSILSLMTLNQMLTQAQNALPPRPASQPEDAGDKLTLQMIANVKRQFKCSTPAVSSSPSWREDPIQCAGVEHLNCRFTFAIICSASSSPASSGWEAGRGGSVFWAWASI